MSDYTPPEHCGACGDPTSLCQCKAGEAVAEPSREQQEIQAYIALWGSTRGEAERVTELQARVQALEQEIAEKDKLITYLEGYGPKPLNDALEAAEARVAVLEKERDDLERRLDYALEDCHATAEKAEKEASDLRAERDELQRRDLLQLRNKKVLEANERLRAALRRHCFTHGMYAGDEALLSAGEHEEK